MRDQRILAETTKCIADYLFKNILDYVILIHFVLKISYYLISRFFFFFLGKLWNYIKLK